MKKLVRKVLGIERREMAKQQKEMRTKRYAQQHRADLCVLDMNVNKDKRIYWCELIQNCNVQKSGELMEMLDYYQVKYDLLKGGK